MTPLDWLLLRCVFRFCLRRVSFSAWLDCSASSFVPFAFVCLFVFVFGFVGYGVSILFVVRNWCFFMVWLFISFLSFSSSSLFPFFSPRLSLSFIFFCTPCVFLSLIHVLSDLSLFLQKFHNVIPPVRYFFSYAICEQSRDHINSGMTQSFVYIQSLSLFKQIVMEKVDNKTIVFCCLHRSSFYFIIFKISPLLSLPLFCLSSSQFLTLSLNFVVLPFISLPRILSLSYSFPLFLSLEFS